MTPWTVRTLIESATALLERSGASSPRTDAEWLLCDLLGFTRLDVVLKADRPVDDAERDAFRERVRRRGVGEPVAYITGTRGFWTLDLKVDPRVLIPRPETELLVELALRHVASARDAPWRIVDVGTGSGALALALAAELPRARLLAIDASADALECARENAERLGLRERVRFVRGDLLAPLAGRSGSVDLVVSNPPYVAEGDPDLDPRVAEFEPHAALFAGADGLDVVRRLIPQAAAALAPGGLLLVELGARQGAAAAALAAEARLMGVRIERDLSRLERVLVARVAGAPPYEATAPSTPDAGDESRRQGLERGGDDDGAATDPGGDDEDAAALPVVRIDEL